MCVHRIPIAISVVSIALMTAEAAAAQAQPLPEGLFSPEPTARVAAIAEVEAQRNEDAIDKLASMARSDAVAEVREAACRALGVLKATAHVDLVRFVSTGDANDAVRAAAAKALRQIRGEKEPEPKPFLPPEPAAPTPAATADDAYKVPELVKPKEEEIQTLHFAFGFGSMGGYGLAAIDMRGRIPVPAKYLPWIGIELGGGWTPPQVYVMVSGLMDPVTGDDVRWKLISGGAAILFYLHRNHYIPLRGGFDIGQGPYGQIGYGFEMLNTEGFFSWGLEVGLHIHPAAAKFARKIVERDDYSDGNNPNIWVVAPFVRFVLHFYLI
jgi:hypothetical protein